MSKRITHWRHTIVFMLGWIWHQARWFAGEVSETSRAVAKAGGTKSPCFALTVIPLLCLKIHAGPANVSNTCHMGCLESRLDIRFAMGSSIECKCYLIDWEWLSRSTTSQSQGIDNVGFDETLGRCGAIRRIGIEDYATEDMYEALFADDDEEQVGHSNTCFGSFG